MQQNHTDVAFILGTENIPVTRGSNDQVVVGQAKCISASCSTHDKSRNGTSNITNSPKPTMFHWHTNSGPDLQRFTHSNNRSILCVTIHVVPCPCRHARAQSGCTRSKVGNCSILISVVCAVRNKSVHSDINIFNHSCIPDVKHVIVTSETLSVYFVKWRPEIVGASITPHYCAVSKVQRRRRAITYFFNHILSHTDDIRSVAISYIGLTFHPYDMTVMTIPHGDLH